MKIASTVAAVIALVPCTLAQSSFIRTPTNGTTLARGASFTVQLVRPPYIQSQKEIGIAIGLQHCPSATFCDVPTNILGTDILYKGAYDPVGSGQPYQNFTVTIPSGALTGTAQIGIARHSLLGVSNAPYSDFPSVQVNVV